MKIFDNITDIVRDDLKRAIGQGSRECVDWIRRKVVFKSNVTWENMGVLRRSLSFRHDQLYY